VLRQIGDREHADRRLRLPLEAAEYIINCAQVTRRITAIATACPNHGVPSSDYGAVETGRCAFEGRKR
jgi:hypothetical protein